MSRAVAVAQDAGSKVKVGLAGSIELIFWGLLFGHLIKWAVDACYYLIVGAPWAPLKDAWDRAPVHIYNLLGHPAWLGHFLSAGQAAPPWWVTDRHAARDYIIAALVGIMVLVLVSKPRKERADYGAGRMAASPFLAVLFSLPVLIGGLALLNTPAGKTLLANGITVPGHNVISADVNQWLGKGVWPVLVIGLLGSFLAKVPMKGPADEIQWYYAEHGWQVGPPGFRARVRWLAQKAVKPAVRSRWMSRVVVLGSLFVLGSAGYGFWLSEFGPASHAAKIALARFGLVF